MIGSTTSSTSDLPAFCTSLAPRLCEPFWLCAGDAGIDDVDDALLREICPSCLRIEAIVRQEEQGAYVLVVSVGSRDYAREQPGGAVSAFPAFPVVVLPKMGLVFCSVSAMVFRSG